MVASLTEALSQPPGRPGSTQGTQAQPTRCSLWDLGCAKMQAFPTDLPVLVSGPRGRAGMRSRRSSAECPTPLALDSPPLSPPSRCPFSKGKFRGVPKTTLNHSLQGLTEASGAVRRTVVYGRFSSATRGGTGGVPQAGSPLPSPRGLGDSTYRPGGGTPHTVSRFPNQSAEAQRNVPAVTHVLGPAAPVSFPLPPAAGEGGSCRCSGQPGPGKHRSQKGQQTEVSRSSARGALNSFSAQGAC